ncbi:MAG: LCP family protein [Oscillospiraceae bacterium]
MNRDKQLSVKCFVLSFAAAFLVLSILTMLSTMAVHPLTPKETIAEQQNEIPYLPRQEDCMTVLVIGTKETTAIPQTYMLIGFNPVKGQIPILTLPGTTIIKQDGKTKLLAEIYNYGGGNMVKKALSNTFDINIDNVAVINQDAFCRLVNLAGSVEYTVPYPLSYTRGDMQVDIADGRQLMDASRMMELITYKGYNGGEATRCSVTSDMATRAINQHLKLCLSNDIDTIFRTAVNLMQTDISYIDYEKRKKALTFMSELEDKPANNIPLSGEFDSKTNTFLLNQSMYDLIKYVYTYPQKTPKQPLTRETVSNIQAQE